MHWGKGELIEEASCQGRYHEPSIQLMQFEDGSRCIRFCYYHHGRFQRSPLILSSKELNAMGEALRKTPKLSKLLRHMLVS